VGQLEMARVGWGRAPRHSLSMRCGHGVHDMRASRVWGQLGDGSDGWGPWASERG
jgi:hypothetical protein